MSIKVIHQRAKCIGCGSCVLEAPHSWFIDETDGLATLKGSIQKGDFFVGRIDESELEVTKKASEYCPVCIIKLVNP